MKSLRRLKINEVWTTIGLKSGDRVIAAEVILNHIRPPYDGARAYQFRVEYKNMDYGEISLDVGYRNQYFFDRKPHCSVELVIARGGVKGIGAQATMLAIEAAKQANLNNRVAGESCYGSGAKWLRLGYKPVDNLSDAEVIRLSNGLTIGEGVKMFFPEDRIPMLIRIIQDHFRI